MADEETEVRPSRRPFPWIASALVVAVALAGVFAVLWRGASDTTPEEVDDFLSSSAGEIEDVTNEVVDLLINYDSESLEERSESILPLATGSFRQEYERLVGEGLGEALEEAGASSEGEVVDGPEVSFVSSSEAHAVVRTRQRTQSRQNPDGVTFLYVMRITLLDMGDGGWKADDVEILSRETAAG